MDRKHALSVVTNMVNFRIEALPQDVDREVLQTLEELRTSLQHFLGTVFDDFEADTAFDRERLENAMRKLESAGMDLST